MTDETKAHQPKEIEPTFAEKAVGLNFNPSNNPAVDRIKLDFARIIEGLHSIREQSVDGEVKRMLSVAITEAQTSCMWAVKAITWQY